MIKGINRYSWFFSLIPFVLLQSCNNAAYTDSIQMPGKKWELMNIPSFSVPVDDTINSHDVIFSIRTGSAYPFRNIYLFVQTTSPDGKFITDTLEYYLADEKGNWFGKGFGDIHELDLPYKSNVYFPVKGTYQFNIRHGMRIEDLNGVYDFGLRIKRTAK
jgi:gliding motility-associated lipoprotein GldH